VTRSPLLPPPPLRLKPQSPALPCDLLLLLLLSVVLLLVLEVVLVVC
jgi:hypothetical protein